MRRVLATTAAALVMAGCGSSGHSGVTGSEVSTYAALAQQIGSTAGAYGASAAASPEPAACASIHASYDAEVRPLVDRMRSMSGAMDDQLATMGHAADGDLGCGADAMEAELAHHDAVACTSTSMAANHAEAGRHATAMTAWATHQHARAAEMGGMMGVAMMMGPGGGMDPGGATTGMMDPGGMSTTLFPVDPVAATTAATCRRSPDGTFTMGPPGS